MKLKKIVVGTDFSDHSIVAIEASIDLARHTGAEVVLVRATKLPDYARLDEVPRSKWQVTVGKVVADHRARLRALCASYDGRGVEISQMVIDDDPARGIIEIADELEADLIAVGTHGRSGIGQLLLGSVAWRVLRHARTSVLVAKPRTDGMGFRRRILVPTDYSRSAELALALASELVCENGEVDLLHCLNIPSEIAQHWLDVQDKAVASLGQALSDEADRGNESLLAAYASERATFTTALVNAGARAGIRRRLDERKYDLVVMGSRGLTGVYRWHLGSVAATAVRHAPCSVMVVREHK